MSDLTFRTEIDFAYGEPRTLAPGVRRIVANNPGVFTYKGTNTYIIGQGDDLAVIDPGPEDKAHFAALMAAVDGRRVSHILITHTHPDHVDGLPRFAKATGAAVCGYGHAANTSGKTHISPSGGTYADLPFTMDIRLADGDRVAGSDWSLTAVFTPGHTPDHMCFQLDDTEILFSGDHVMAWNTSVIAPPEGNMADYLASLEKLLERKYSVYYPGHGGQVPEPKRFTKAYLVHRRLREQAILAAIGNGHVTIADIVRRIYKGIDPRLVPAAALSVQAHIEHMSQRGLVDAAQPMSSTSPIALISKDNA
ncbi:MAG: MBL fold metallo-hydrolase [Pseudomonadota bacterium]